MKITNLIYRLSLAGCLLLLATASLHGQDREAEFTRLTQTGDAITVETLSKCEATIGGETDSPPAESDDASGEFIATAICEDVAAYIAQGGDSATSEVRRNKLEGHISLEIGNVSESVSDSLSLGVFIVNPQLIATVFDPDSSSPGAQAWSRITGEGQTEYSVKLSNTIDRFIEHSLVEAHIRLISRPVFSKLNQGLMFRKFEDSEILAFYFPSINGSLDYWLIGGEIRFDDWSGRGPLIPITGFYPGSELDLTIETRTFVPEDDLADHVFEVKQTTQYDFSFDQDNEAVAPNEPDMTNSIIVGGTIRRIR